MSINIAHADIICTSLIIPFHRPWYNRENEMAEDRIILLANRGDGVDEVPNDEYIVDDELDETGCWFIIVHRCFCRKLFFVTKLIYGIIWPEEF